MMLIIFLSSLCVWVRGTTFNIISERIANQLRYDIFIHLMNKDVGFYDKNKTGDLLSRMANDVSVV